MGEFDDPGDDDATVLEIELVDDSGPTQPNNVCVECTGPVTVSRAPRPDPDALRDAMGERCARRAPTPADDDRDRSTWWYCGQTGGGRFVIAFRA